MEKVIQNWKDIELSQKALEAIANLKKGQVLAVRMRHVNSSTLEKVQVEFAEKLALGNRVITAATIFNADDSRFSQGAQRCWETMSLDIATQMFGEIPDGKASVEILSVLDAPAEGQKFAMQVQEVLESELNESETDYIDNYLKRAGAEGNFFYAEGTSERVGTRRRLIIVNEDEAVPHTLIKGAYLEEPSTNTNKSVISSDLASVEGK